jgi:hypothetical protein
VVVLEKHFYGPKLQHDVSKYIRSYTACAISNLAIKKKCLYIHLPTPENPWESISIDYMAILPSTKQDNDCVFLVVDRFSKIVILTACKKNIIAADIDKIFFKRVWVHFGIPQTIIFDRDNRFLKTFWSSLWSLLENKLTKFTAFHTQTNDQTKVINRMIVHILCMYNSKHPCTWDERLPYVQHNYNRALHRSIITVTIGLSIDPSSQLQ